MRAGSVSVFVCVWGRSYWMGCDCMMTWRGQWPLRYSTLFESSAVPCQVDEVLLWSGGTGMILVVFVSFCFFHYIYLRSVCEEMLTSWSRHCRSLKSLKLQTPGFTRRRLFTYGMHWQARSKKFHDVPITLINNLLIWEWVIWIDTNDISITNPRLEWYIISVIIAVMISLI